MDGLSLFLSLLCFSLLPLSPPVPFSLTLPHCLQLHLFPSMWQMIAGLFFSWYSTPASALSPLLFLSSPLSLTLPLRLSLLTLSASHNASFPVLLLTVNSLFPPKPRAGGQTKCTFIACVKETGKETERDTEKEERGHSPGHYCPPRQ